MRHSMMKAVPHIANLESETRYGGQDGPNKKKSLLNSWKLLHGHFCPGLKISILTGSSGSFLEEVNIKRSLTISIPVLKYLLKDYSFTLLAKQMSTIWKCIQEIKEITNGGGWQCCSNFSTLEF